MPCCHYDADTRLCCCAAYSSLSLFFFRYYAIQAFITRRHAVTPLLIRHAVYYAMATDAITPIIFRRLRLSRELFDTLLHTLRRCSLL